MSERGLLDRTAPWHAALPHWLRGLLFEIMAVVVFLLALSGLVAAIGYAM